MIRAKKEFTIIFTCLAILFVVGCVDKRISIKVETNPNNVVKADNISKQVPSIERGDKDLVEAEILNIDNSSTFVATKAAAFSGRANANYMKELIRIETEKLQEEKKQTELLQQLVSKSK